jgi:hypothetical protein
MNRIILVLLASILLVGDVVKCEEEATTAAVAGEDADATVEPATELAPPEAELAANATTGPEGGAESAVTTAPEVGREEAAVTTASEDGGEEVAITTAPDVGGEAAAVTTAPEDGEEEVNGTADAPKTEGEEVAVTEGPPAEAGNDTVTDAPSEGEKVVVVIATTEVPVEPVTERSFPAGDPCGNHTGLDGRAQHYSQTVKEDDFINDREREDGWYSFIYDTKPAIITQEIIKPDQCGTHFSFHLDLNGHGLPAEMETTAGVICGVATTNKGILTCIESEKIQVRNCIDFYIYKLQPFKRKQAVGMENTGSAVCLQDPDEEIPAHFLVQMPTEPPPTTEAPPKSDLDVIAINEATGEQLAGTATVVFDYPHDPKTKNLHFKQIDEKYRQSIADKLNEMPDEVPPPPPTTPEPEEEEEDTDQIVVDLEDQGKATAPPKKEQEGPQVPDVDTEADAKGPGSAAARRKRKSQTPYTADDVKYVGVPSIKDGSLRVSTLVESTDGDVVSSERQVEALKSLNETGDMEETADMNVTAIYVGLPEDLAPVAGVVGKKTGSEDIWKKHEGLFITIIVLALLCLLIIIIGLLCIRYRNSRGSWSRSREGSDSHLEGGSLPKKKAPKNSVESPIADEEIMRDDAPMMEKENPALTKNGNGQHISKKDEDNGWVVPIDELRSDKDKMDMEDTKL